MKSTHKIDILTHCLLQPLNRKAFYIYIENRRQDKYDSKNCHNAYKKLF